MLLNICLILMYHNVEPVIYKGFKKSVEKLLLEAEEKIFLLVGVEEQ